MAQKTIMICDRCNEEYRPFHIMKAKDNEMKKNGMKDICISIDCHAYPHMNVKIDLCKDCIMELLTEVFYGNGE